MAKTTPDLLAELASRLDELFEGKIPALIDLTPFTTREEQQLAQRCNQLFDFLRELSDFISALAEGTTIPTPPQTDHFLAPVLRKLHSQLLHLTWQAKQVADGDYSQRFTFLGEFAAAFNAMIIAMAQKEKILVSLARTDGLTGIHNRESLNNLLEIELYRSKRYKSPLAVILFDIDHFKKINDTFGHQRGDAVLKTMVNLVQSNLRSTDIFGRWGGEEFLIAAPGISSEQGLKLAEKIRRLVQDHDFPEVHQVTASFGVTAYRPDDSVDTLLRRADLALYKAKGGGRNRVVLI